ncbi:cytochrome P450 [Lophiostoma macrostomum CBS 122681]|uniref:Cytochrome P450 n=1 Tax=Lophiostoma macrostomum CBS 122681 TaxID=1314788 RepID=A0A6A6SSS4_9PLEO|nr:cytochrome P450 [Lophiostoma macrostomum CBS 122681]
MTRDSTRAIAFIFSFTIIFAGCFIRKGYNHRRRIKDMQKQRVPMPAWNWVFGHILYFYKTTRQLPPYANVNLVMKEIATDFTDDEMYLLDLWPVAEPTLVVFNADAASHVCQELNLPKSGKNETMIRPITGGPTLLSVNGNAWKTWRSLLNPGFSTNTMTQRLPQMVDSVSRYCSSLREHAGKDIIQLDEHTTRLTFEIITKMVLDVDVGIDYSNHIFVRAMDNIIKWHSFWDVRVLVNPLRPFAQWYNGHTINSWVEDVLKKRHQALINDAQAVSAREQPRPKSIIDLAIEGSSAGGKSDLHYRLDNVLLRNICHHVRLFLFVGNDSTSSTLVFTYHMLSKHPKVLQRLRAEHNEVFQDASRVPEQLKENPELLNKCTYTQAVLKETLRLYPPAATMRVGTPDTSVMTARGVRIPTNDMTVLVSHTSIHSNPNLWVRASDFLPKRWLVESGHELHPKPGAWRAFEAGPRNCIGQTLAIMEMKIALAMTARTFVIEPAYEEFQSIQRNRKSWLMSVAVSMLPRKAQMNTYRGDVVFQTEKAGAHPSEGYPCRITLS